MYETILNNPLTKQIPIEYNQLVELQNAIDNSNQTNLPQGAWKINVQPPQWMQIIKKSQEILTTQCKNLQVFFIWMQATLASQGLKALLKTSLEYKAFLESFPLTENDNLTIQKADIILANTIKNASLLENDIFSYNDYLLAKKVEEKSIYSNNPNGFIAAELPQSKTLSFFNSHKFELDNSKIQNIINAAKIMQDLEEVNRVLQQIIPLLTTEPATELQTLETKTDSKEISNNIQITTQRAQAYQQLRQISAFLIKNEPHAFTGYILQKLASLENASLMEALKTMPEIANLIK